MQVGLGEAVTQQLRENFAPDVGLRHCMSSPTYAFTCEIPSRGLSIKRFNRVILIGVDTKVTCDRQ